MRQDQIETDWEQQQIDRLDSEQFWQTPFGPYLVDPNHKPQRKSTTDPEVSARAERLDRWCLREKLLGRTLRSIGSELGVSVEMIRWRVARAMGRLRHSQPEVYQHLQARFWPNEK